MVTVLRLLIAVPFMVLAATGALIALVLGVGVLVIVAASWCLWWVANELRGEETAAITIARGVAVQARRKADELLETRIH